MSASDAIKQDLRSEFIAAFRRRADTVCVVTHLDGEGQPCGMTATSVCSVSADPPMLIACVNRSTRTFEAIKADGRFAVNVLSRGQQHIASRCAIPGGDKTLDDCWLDRSPDRHRLLKLAGAAAYVNCVIDAAYGHGTHAVLVGLVQDVTVAPHRYPLLYFDGTFRELEALTGDPRMESWWIT